MKKITLIIALALIIVAIFALASCGEEPVHVHVEETISGIDATCTENGLTEGKKCADCGEILVPQETIVGSHSEEIIAAVSPTCTKEGLTEGKKCTSCDEILIAQEAVPPIGEHRFENSYVCVLCGEEIYKASEGLVFKLSDDQTYYIVSSRGTCADENVVIPYTHEGLPVKKIGVSAFENFKIMKSVLIPDSITEIGGFAFDSCVALEEVVIPDSVTKVLAWAFYNCQSVTTAKIGKGVEEVGMSAFGWCRLTSIEVDEKNQYYKSIDGNLYTKNGDVLVQYAIDKPETKFEIPSHVTNIGKFAFDVCTNLTEVVIPNGLTVIDEFAFNGCANLTKIEIPSSVVRIADRAFCYCTSLEKIVIPNNVTIVGGLAFYECDKLTIYCERVSAPDGWASDWNFTSCPVEWGYSS